MRSGRPTVTVVGSFLAGLTLRVPRFPVRGETLIGSNFDMGPGGKGSNQAVGAARLGAESYLLGVIGTDSFGDMAVNLYQQEGVHTAYVQRTSDCPTGVGFITVDAAGDNHIVIDPGASALLMPSDVDAADAQIARSDVVLSVLEIRPETAGRAMELARRHNVLAVLNPAPATPLPASVLQAVDVLTPNDSELRTLLDLPPDDPTPTLELARRLQERGVRNVVATRGSRGALIVHENGTAEEVPGVAVDVVDSTGAGDAFTCALGVCLAEGRSLADAVRFAVCAGALACTRAGVIPSLPFRSAVDELLRTRASDSA